MTPIGVKTGAGICAPTGTDATFIEIDGVNGAIGVLKFNYNLVVPSTLTPMGRNGSNQFQFLITGKPGMAFSIQHTTNLKSWTNLFSGTDPDGSYVFTDMSPTPPRPGSTGC